MKTLQFNFEANFPACGHAEKLTASSRAGMQELAKMLFERQNGLCGNCYAKYCEKHNATPWYSNPLNEVEAEYYC